ncbi:hypothetical protein BLA24064_03953 [Burkholderia latens]|uniref:Uncharacterized protein n=1 Tax=Burkholderia latens TaxID=488446 RepID=A0A6P2MTG3_9BURK|nr:hypothetical protein BLA24064_03953 [Burkholderia latens]
MRDSAEGCASYRARNAARVAGNGIFCFMNVSRQRSPACCDRRISGSNPANGRTNARCSGLRSGHEGGCCTVEKRAGAWCGTAPRPCMPIAWGSRSAAAVVVNSMESACATAGLHGLVQQAPRRFQDASTGCPRNAIDSSVKIPTRSRAQSQCNRDANVRTKSVNATLSARFTRCPTLEKMTSRLRINRSMRSIGFWCLRSIRRHSMRISIAVQ